MKALELQDHTQGGGDTGGDDAHVTAETVDEEEDKRSGHDDDDDGSGEVDNHVMRMMIIMDFTQNKSGKVHFMGKYAGGKMIIT